MDEPTCPAAGALAKDWTTKRHAQHPQQLGGQLQHVSSTQLQYDCTAVQWPGLSERQRCGAAVVAGSQHGINILRRECMCAGCVQHVWPATMAVTCVCMAQQGQGVWGATLLCVRGITSAPAGAVSRMQCSQWRHLLAASCAWALPPPTRATRAAVDCSTEAWGLCLPAAAGVHCGIAAGILGMVLPIALGSHWTSQLMVIIVSA